MQKLLFLALTLATVVGSAGCASLGMTPWSSPGTAQLQHQRAERFDPYPQALSGSESVGTRPRDYDKPPLVPGRDPWPWSQPVQPQ